MWYKHNIYIGNSLIISIVNLMFANTIFAAISSLFCSFKISFFVSEVNSVTVCYMIIMFDSSGDIFKEPEASRTVLF